jgi:hypothetical protein
MMSPIVIWVGREPEEREKLKRRYSWRGKKDGVCGGRMDNAGCYFLFFLKKLMTIFHGPALWASSIYSNNILKISLLIL